MGSIPSGRNYTVYVGEHLTWDQAMTNCTNQGMRLPWLETAMVNSAFFSAAYNNSQINQFINAAAPCVRKFLLHKETINDANTLE